MIEVIKRQPKQIILTALCRMAEQGPFYVYAAFIFTYGTTVCAASRDFLLTALLVATGLSAVTIPLAGLHLRPHRPQADVPDRRGHDRGFSASSTSR